jgi:hypothetical protein
MSLRLQHGAHQREHRVAFAGGPDREGDPASRPEHPSALREGRRGVGHQHVAPAAEDAVDAVRLQVHAFGVQHPNLRVPRANLFGPPLSRGDHPGGKIRDDHAPRLAYQARREQPGVARAGRQLQHGIAGLRIEPPHQPLAHRARDPPQLLPPRAPAGSHGTPGGSASPARLFLPHRYLVGYRAPPPWNHPFVC